MEHFRNHAADANVKSPGQIVVVGDRLSTDMMMANMMGFWSIWIKDGVVDQKNLVSLCFWHKKDLLSDAYQYIAIAMGVSVFKLSVAPRLCPPAAITTLQHRSGEVVKVRALPDIGAWLQRLSPACSEAPKGDLGAKMLNTLYLFHESLLFHKHCNSYQITGEF